LSSAAVIAVYGAGYTRTRSAAARFEHEPALRRPAPAAPEFVARAIEPEPAPVPAALAPEPATRTTVSTTTPAKTVVPAAAKPIEPAAAPPVASAVTTPAPIPEPVVDAPPPAEATPVAAPATKAAWKDGTYSGWGTSRHGDIQATVVIEGGRITSATISQCLTRYSCSWIAHLQGQVVTRQSADVDYVSGATQSTDAFYYAVVDALTKAK
jgi:uncharacterized protein with FMN-binding domain